MKKLWGCVILFFLFSLLRGQNKQLLYDFSEIPQSLMVNPGVETDFDWYAGVPMLSGISAHASSTGISVNDIFADDGLDINVKVRERMVNGLSTRDQFMGNANLELLSGGYRSENPNIFYSFGVYMEMDNVTYWPQDYAYLAFDGNVDQLGRKFDLGDLKSRGSLVNVFHFGINKKIDESLTIGARGKLYSSIADYNTTSNSGYLVNTEGQNNLLSTTISADLKLRSSGFGELRRAEKDEILGGALAKRAFFGGDLGLGLDLGFSYHLNERTVLTGSLLDLGIIYHTGDVYTYSLKGNAEAEGIEINLLEDFADLNRDFWQDLVDKIEETVPFDTSKKGYISFRPTKLNASLRHDFGRPIGNSSNLDCDCTAGSSRNRLRVKYRNSLGAQVYGINRPRGPQFAFTAFYLRRFGNVMALKTTYTADKFSYTNLGLGLNLQAGPINIYVLADNLLGYQNIAASHYASFQLGLNIISWGKK